MSWIADTGTAISCCKVSFTKPSGVNFVGALSGRETVEPIIDLGVGREVGEGVEVRSEGTVTTHITTSWTIMANVGISLQY